MVIVHRLVSEQVGVAYLDDVGEESVGVEGGAFEEAGRVGVVRPYVACLEGFESCVDLSLALEGSKCRVGSLVAAHEPHVSIVGTGKDLFGRESYRTALLVFGEGYASSCILIDATNRTARARLIPDVAVEGLADDDGAFFGLLRQGGELLIVSLHFLKYSL